MFGPPVLHPNSPRRVLSEVPRWNIHLSRFVIFIDHIEGANNVLADMLTKWAKGYRVALAEKVAALYTDIVPSANEAKFITVQEIINKQQKHQYPVGIEMDGVGVYRKDQQAWMPNEKETLSYASKMSRIAESVYAVHTIQP